MTKLNNVKLSDSLVQELAYILDFDLTRIDEDVSWIKLSKDVQFDVIAGDASGGVFIAYGLETLENRPVLYASSEGQAGKIASNFIELLGLLMTIPFWPDLLKFSGGGKLIEMRKTAVFAQREFIEDAPDFPNFRKRLLDNLPHAISKDAIQALHNSVHSTDCTLVAEDGEYYDSLFNSFVSSDNPMWK